MVFSSRQNDNWFSLLCHPLETYYALNAHVPNFSFPKTITAFKAWT
jgi:hypothetical protein